MLSSHLSGRRQGLLQCRRQGFGLDLSVPGARHRGKAGMREAQPADSTVLPKTPTGLVRNLEDKVCVWFDDLPRGIGPQRDSPMYPRRDVPENIRPIIIPGNGC